MHQTPRTAKGLRAAAAGKAAWLVSARWRRAVEAELASLGLTFTEWLVLETTDELVREMGDAVTQNAVAARAELDKMTVSHVMRKLEKRGLIAREPAFGRPAWHVLLGRQGRRAVASARLRVEAASQRVDVAS